MPIINQLTKQGQKRAGDKSLPLLKKATDGTLEPCSVHEVKSSLEIDLLRLINQLNRVSISFFPLLQVKQLTRTPVPNWS